MDRDVLLEHAGFLRRLAQSLLHDSHAAEDVVQDTFLAALRSAPPETAHPGRWLARVARNLALTARRARVRRDRRERAASAAGRTPPVDEAVARLEVQRRVVDAVLALEEPYRSAVIHRYFYARSLKECARALDVPLATVRTRLARALEQLRGRLDREHGGDRRAWALALLTVLPRPNLLRGALLMGTKLKIAAALLLVGGLAWFVVAARSRAPVAARGEARLASRDAPLRDAAPPAPVATEPDRDRDVFGIVVDPVGTPVCGARVAAIAHPARRIAGATGAFIQMAQPRAATVTGADGTFVMRLTRGELVTLCAEATGFPRIEMEQVQAGERVRLVLERPVTLRVLAQDATGAPVPGVRVTVIRVAPPVPGATCTREGVTDGAGTCTFDTLPGRGHAMVMVDGAKGDFVPLPETGEIEHTVHVAPAVTGRVTDAATGAPLPGAVVRAWPTDGPGTRTDADGRYRVPAAKECVEAAADGYASLQLAVTDGGVDFALRRGSTVRGRCLDPAGHAVAGALVWAAGADFRIGHRLHSESHARTDEGGRFVLTGLHPEQPHTLVVLADGCGRTLLDLPAGDRDCGDLVLPAGRSIEGRLTDDAGRPVARALVRIEGANEDRGRILGIPPPVIYGNVEERLTDDLGRFRFPDLAPGRYTLTARQGRRGPPALREVRLESADVLNADLRWAATRDFRVRVQDEEGRPLARVLVRVDRQMVATGVDGVAPFHLAGEPRMIAVDALASREAPSFLAPPPVHDLAPGLAEYVVTVLRAGDATGRAVDAAGRPLQRAALEVWVDADLVGTSTTDEEGRFTARVPVARGAEVRLAEGLEGRLADVRAGATDLLLRAAAATGQVRLRVVDPAGDPVPDVIVRAGPATGRTDAAGRVALAAPSDREVVVEVSLSPYRKAERRWVPPQPLLVVAGGAEIRLAMSAGVPIRGIVERPHGKGAGGVLVAAYRGEVRAAHTTADEAGRFVLIVPQDGGGAFRILATDGTWRSDDTEALPDAMNVVLRLDRAE